MERCSSIHVRGFEESGRTGFRKTNHNPGTYQVGYSCGQYECAQATEMLMPIEVKEFKGGRLVHHQMVREDNPDHYLDERFEIFEGRFGLQVTRRPGMLVVKRLVKQTAVYWKEVKTNEPVWAMGDKYYHYYPVENGIRWKSETTIYKGIYGTEGKFF